MGIIRKIGFIFVFFCAHQIFAQNNNDTVYFSGKRFVEHVVKGGESLKSIATLHKVTTSEIKEANELERRLFYNQLLYIPIYLSDRNEVIVSVKELALEEDRSVNSIINIALLMPYYLIKNDTMFNYDDKAVNVSNLYYNKSESALSFHVGVELAIDSLRSAGKRIILHTFDTNQDSLVVKRLVRSNKLDKMDMIIGPMFSKLFHIVCKKYGYDGTKTLISPLSRDNKRIIGFPSVYQIALTYKVQADILTKYLLENKINERIIILNTKKDERLAKYVEYKFRKENKLVDYFQITNTKVDSIRQYFIEKQNVLLLSTEKAFIGRMLGSIGSIDSVSTVFLFESILSYDNLDITNLMELDVHVPNSRDIDLSISYDLSFVSSFEEEYSTNVQKYTKVGYDIIMHFYGKTNVYDFKKIENGYHENILAPIYHYSDYQLVPIK
jgi:hypothetical protein